MPSPSAPDAPVDVASIAARLGLDPERLSALAAYDGEQLAVLDEAIAVTMRAEDRAIEEGLSDALRLIPRPLRGRAKALVLGSRRG